MKISIITPSYNQNAFIERTILSVVSQKGDFALEYIIVDGGSNDGSVDIIKNVQLNIENGSIKTHCQKIDFIWRSENDNGQSDAINKGLRLATGDIISYLNSDDTYEPGALQKVVDSLGHSSSQWCYGKCHIIDIHDKEIRRYITWYKNLVGKKYSYGKLLSQNFISQMTVFWKKEAMDHIGLFDENEHLCMDYDYWLRLGEYYNPAYIDEYLGNFRFYHTSKSGSRFVKQFGDALRLAKKYAGTRYPVAIFLHTLTKNSIILIYKILHIFQW